MCGGSPHVLRESGIHETFAYGIRNPGKFCLWNPESGKILLVKFRNPGKFCLWNPESGKSLLVESGIRETFAFRIRNPGNFYLVESGIRESFACGIRNLGNFILWNPESWALEFGSQLKESGILLTIGIRNLSPTDTD